jgi:hypothetical protein
VVCSFVRLTMRDCWWSMIHTWAQGVGQWLWLWQGGQAVSVELRTYAQIETYALAPVILVPRGSTRTWRTWCVGVLAEQTTMRGGCLIGGGQRCTGRCCYRQEDCTSKGWPEVIGVSGVQHELGSVQSRQGAPAIARSGYHDSLKDARFLDQQIFEGCRYVLAAKDAFARTAG